MQRTTVLPQAPFSLTDSMEGADQLEEVEKQIYSPCRAGGRVVSRKSLCCVCGVPRDQYIESIRGCIMNKAEYIRLSRTPTLMRKNSLQKQKRLPPMTTVASAGAMLQREEESDAEVRREDQDNINKFAGLNARLHELRAEKEALKVSLPRFQIPFLVDSNNANYSQSY